MKKSSDDQTTMQKLDRKIIERNRRIHMKALCFKLASLVPSQHHNTISSKDMPSQQGQLELAAAYIIQLRERIDELKRRKDMAKGANNRMRLKPNTGTKPPLIQLREWESGLAVTLISEANKNFMLYQVISILHDEGADVVSASFSTLGDKIFHTLHAQVKILRVGIETSRVWERLQELTTC